VTVQPASVPSPGAGGYDADQVRNQKIVVSLLESNHVPELGVMAALCACCGENNWHSEGCDTVTGTHCGLWQLSPTFRAMHDYRDNEYWTRYAIQHGFYGQGGITHIANAHPDWSPGEVAEACQGAGASAVPYYNSFQAEARRIWNRYSTQVGQVITQAAKLYANPLKDANVTAERIDMGVDYAGTGHFSAIAKGVVTEATNYTTGWTSAHPGGYVEYRITQEGPLHGVHVYHSEGVSTRHKVGDELHAGDWVCRLRPGWPTGTESGFAAGNGGEATWAAVYGGGYSEGQLTRAGLAFSRLVQHLGGPGGLVEGRAPVGEWPPWMRDGRAPAGVTPGATVQIGGLSPSAPSESAASAASSYDWPTAQLNEWNALSHGVQAALGKAKAVRDYVSKITFLKTPKG